MKKICTAFFAAVMAIFMVCAAACGDSDSGSSNVVGTWKMVYDTSSMTAEEAAQFEVVKALAPTMELSFNSDGTGKGSGAYSGDTTGGSFKWSQSGDEITVTNPDTGATKKFHLRSGKLYFDEADWGADSARIAYMEKK